MSTWPEARAAKIERDRREARKLQPGPRCPVCQGVTSRRLFEATGDARHPCCTSPLTTVAR